MSLVYYFLGYLFPVPDPWGLIIHFSNSIGFTLKICHRNYGLCSWKGWADDNQGGEGRSETPDVTDKEAIDH